MSEEERSGGWNFRVFETPEGVEIREVYYDEAGQPNGCTWGPAKLVSESVEDLQWGIERAMEALSKPPLKEEDLF